MAKVNNKNEEVVVESVNEAVAEKKQPSKTTFKVFNNSNRTFIISKNTILKGMAFAELSKEEFEKIKNFKQVKLIK